MRVSITKAELERIGSEGESTYPHECCGLLIGRWVDGEQRVVEDIRPMENARFDSPENRYLIRPEKLLKIIREVEARDQEVVGFYHSHPDVTAVPSAFDREHAWTGYSYLIVRVVSGRQRETRAWALAEDRGEFVEAELTIEESVSPEPVSSRGAS
jgi:proteasome lid subunit RPN8/RPN11